MATDKNTAAAETNAPTDYAAQDAAAQAEQSKLEVTVRLIEPKGKQIGFLKMKHQNSMG